MSEQIRTLLADLADEAGTYAEPDRAVAADQRRRRRRAITISAVAALAATIVAGLPPALRFDRGIPPATNATYPPSVTPPAPVQKLPSRRIGAASFIYAPCARDCAAYLVMPDGRQYELPTAAWGGPVGGFTLSPDGAWLGMPTAQGFRLKALVTGTDHTIGGTGPGITEAWAWSADSRWLLLARHTDGSVHEYTRIDLDAGGAFETFDSAASGQDVVAITNDGDFIRWASGGLDGKLPVLAVVDPKTHQELRRIAVTVPPNGDGLLKTGETVRAGQIFVGPDGQTALLAVTKEEPLGPPVAVLEVLLDDGHIMTRLDLPPSRPDTGPIDLWYPHALAHAVVLVHSLPDRTEIVLLDTIVNARSVVCTLPAYSQVVVRDGHR
jgi:hypothetical protein